MTDEKPKARPPAIATLSMMFACVAVGGRGVAWIIGIIVVQVDTVAGRVVAKDVEMFCHQTIRPLRSK